MVASLNWPVAWPVDATLVAFLCVLGGNVASFLNVVAHRAPRGISVVRGGSACPACGSPVRWHDNVPVCGWILLGGRCRDCGSPIAWRYPVVEAVGMLIGAVVAGELFAGGRTWPPGRFGTGRIGADVLLMQPDWPLLLVCLAHAALLFTVLAWALFETDDARVQPRWFLGACLGLGALSVIGGGPTTPGGWPAMREAALGAGVAGLVGLAVGSRTLRQALVLAGLVLGWQGLAGAALLMLLVAGGRAGLGLARGGPFVLRLSCADLLGALAVQVLVWRWWPAIGLVAWCMLRGDHEGG
jgi:leader peptidase (prepilin peptidase) / N-methyltransferase